MNYAIVMAGGKGTRFWPESTSKKPKQYLNIVGENSLLGDTLLRFEGLIDSSSRYIVTVKEQEQLADDCSKNLISEKGLIFEPSGRNTGPCILLAIAELEKQGASDSDVMVIVPADHVILNKNGFQSTVNLAIETSKKENAIVTIGVKPHFPHTGYGYIHQGESRGSDVYKVNQFKEKPDQETAKEYLASGEYLWNAGMFVAPISVLKEEFAKHAANMWTHYEALRLASNEAELEAAYNQIPEDSVDYAIMEKSERVLVTPAQFDWNDLGSWDALESVSEKIKNNVIIGSDAEPYVDQAAGNIVYAPGKHVSLVNVNDLIIVSNEEALMVLPNADSQKVKEIYNALKENESTKYLV